MNRVRQWIFIFCIVVTLSLVAGCEYYSGRLPEPTAVPVIAETSTPAPTATPEPAPTPTATPEPSPTPEPTPEPTPSPSPTIPPMEVKGYPIVGYVTLSKVHIELPVTAECTDASLLVSAGQFWGPRFHEVGNVVISGHNYKNGSHFGKLKQYVLYDTVTLTDLFGRSEVYSVYKIYSVTPDNMEPTEPGIIGSREISLLTCTVGGTKRLIVRCQLAQERFDVSRLPRLWPELVPWPIY